jgi:hypothetical protein
MDKSLNAALRSIGINRHWSPATEYHGDRPNLHWNAFLSRLFPSGTNFCPKVYTHSAK